MSFRYNLPVDYDNLNRQEKRKVREQYEFEQDYKCYYCKQDINVRPEQTEPILWSMFPLNFLKYPVHLHHDHTTGLTLGAVHAYCNAVLWQYEGE